jgi:hypothetical protein
VRINREICERQHKEVCEAAKKGRKSIIEGRRSKERVKSKRLSWKRHAKEMQKHLREMQEAIENFDRDK